MSISTPADLSPRMWLDPNPGPGASYSGSNLSTLTNRGTDGGSFTIVGSPAKGTAIGALTTLQIDAISKRFTMALADFSGGWLSCFYVGKARATATVKGIIGLAWPGGSPNCKSFYEEAGASDTFFFGNGCCAIDALHAPSFYSTAGAISDTNFHTFFGQVGTTNGLWKDDASQTLTNTFTAAMPATGAQTWDVCCADPLSETINSDVAGILMFDYQLTAGNRTDLHNYYLDMSIGGPLMGQAVM